MKLFLNRPAFFYEMENLCRLFLPHESFSHEETPFTESVAGDYAVCDFAPAMRRLFCGVRLADQTVSQTADLPPALPERELEIEMARGLYRLLSKLCGFSPPWGVLTGVRPAKLYSSLLHETGSAAGAQAYMQQRLYVQPEKIALCGHVMAAEEKAAAFFSDIFAAPAEEAALVSEVFAAAAEDTALVSDAFATAAEDAAAVWLFFACAAELAAWFTNFSNTGTSLSEMMSSDASAAFSTRREKLAEAIRSPPVLKSVISQGMSPGRTLIWSLTVTRTVFSEIGQVQEQPHPSGLVPETVATHPLGTG